MAISNDEKPNPEVIFFVSVVITGLFCLFGFVGNILALVALIKDKHKNSNVYLLSALSVADWFMLASIFNGVVTIQFCKYFEYTSYLNYLRTSRNALPILWILGCIVQTNTIWYVVAVTWDRFLAVCCPFQSLKGKSNCIKRAWKFIGGVLLFSIIFNIPRCFHYFPISSTGNYGVSPHLNNKSNLNLHVNGVTKNTSFHDSSSQEDEYNDVEFLYTFKDTDQNTSYMASINGNIDQKNVDEENYIDSFVITPKTAERNNHVKILGDNKWYNYIYYVTISWLVLYIIPMGSLLILNVMLLRQIKRAQKNRTTLLGSKCRESDSLSVTVNIVAIVTMFIICQAPDFIHTLINYKSLGVSSKTKAYMKATAYAFLAFNSSINFIIYCLFYKRFRMTVFRMCCNYVTKYSKQFQLHKFDSRRTSQTSQTYL